MYSGIMSRTAGLLWVAVGTFSGCGDDGGGIVAECLDDIPPEDSLPDGADPSASLLGNAVFEQRHDATTDTRGGRFRLRGSAEHGLRVLRARRRRGQADHCHRHDHLPHHRSPPSMQRTPTVSLLRHVPGAHHGKERGIIEATHEHQSRTSIDR
jgi:hypothetical protein